MDDTTSSSLVLKPILDLSEVLEKPALVGRESLEVYQRFSSSIASAIKPTDAVGHLLTRDVVYWSWEIQRERTIKVEIIKFYQKVVIAELIPLLAPADQLGAAKYRIFQVDADLELYATDRKVRAAIDTALAAKGHETSSILAQAYMRGATQIDAIDRRIAGYERRRNLALKEAGLWNEHLRKHLDQTICDVVEGHFTEAAE